MEDRPLAQVVKDEYVLLAADLSTLDGNFSAGELRKIADAMEAMANVRHYGQDDEEPRS